MDPLSNSNPPQDDAIGIDEALKHIKEWKELGKTEDAIAGIKEVLSIEPDSQEAKDLLAELEGTQTVAAPEVTPVVETPAPIVETPQPEVTPVVETPAPIVESTSALETPQVEALTHEAQKTEEPAVETGNPLYKLNADAETPTETPETSAPTTPKKKGSHGIVMNIVLFIVVVILIGGGVYAYLYFFQGEPEEEFTPPVIETITEEEDVKTEEPATEEEIVEEKTEASHNDQRFEDLTKIETLLEEYYTENHLYPDANELAEALGELPQDPVNEGEFMYSYAVYNNALGFNQEYILAGLFEDENGDHTLWTTGANTEEYTDYRDTSLENVTYITSTEIEVEEEETTPKVKVKVKREVE